MFCIARLDYDSAQDLKAGLGRMRFVLSVVQANGFCPGRVCLRRHRTRRGYHVELTARFRLLPTQMVALQSILGSDFRRETFNLFRALALRSAPTFWQRLGRWNVLHRERIQ